MQEVREVVRVLLAPRSKVSGSSLIGGASVTAVEMVLDLPAGVSYKAFGLPR